MKKIGLIAILSSSAFATDIEIKPEDFTKNSVSVYSVSDNFEGRNAVNQHSFILEPEDFSENSVSVTSTNDKFTNELKKQNTKSQSKMNKFLKKHCSNELRMFCSDPSISNYNCLRDNFNLITGSCKNILEHEFKKGITENRLSIHDLKLTKKTTYLGKQNAIGFVVADYRSYEPFDYRGIRFRKGKLKARNYKYEDYNGQYVVFSGKPSSVFKDEKGISYNPAYQKGPFFFDEAGNVKIGSLNQDYKYKEKIILKAGTVVAFNDNRELVKGTLAKAVRIGRCGFLSGMDISEKQIAECEKKK